jgi:hypothetical protein
MKLSTKRPLRCSVSPDPSGRPDTFTGDRRALRDSDPRAFRRLFRAVADARRHGEELDGGARIVRRVHEILLGTQVSFGFAHVRRTNPLRDRATYLVIADVTLRRPTRRLASYGLSRELYMRAQEDRMCPINSIRWSSR